MTSARRITKSSSLDVHLDERLRTNLDVQLYSEAEGRVPKGAYKAFFNDLLVRHFTQRPLDLAPYLGTEPGTAVIFAQPLVLDALRSYLEKAQCQPT